MTLKELNLKASYDSGMGDNVLDDFYIKSLSSAVEYNRIAGFFSSTSLAISARGVCGLIQNKGKMKLIVSPRLSKEDVEIIKKATLLPESIIEKSMLKEINNIENFIINDHVSALGWLIANGILEIKIALIYDDNNNILDYEKAVEKGIFHIKVGIIKDTEGNIISFSGSINETASGWSKNVEEFKVFKMWELGQNQYCKSDVDKFNAYWNCNCKSVKILNIPRAIEEKLIEKSPKDINEIHCLNKMLFKQKQQNFEISLNLFDYQKQAIELWKNNNKNLIFEMATGTGKTRTAIGCMTSIIYKYISIAFFIVCPQGTLSLQWKNDIKNLNVKFDEFVIADSTIKNWAKELENKLLKVATGISKSCIIYTTFDTFSSQKFINIITNNKFNIKYMLIADEVHGLGSLKRSKGLLDIYNFRLGLSATPERWFDELGTLKLKKYFGEKKFEFNLHDALTTINPLTNKTYLTPYKYIPKFITLTDEELDNYNNLSMKIVKLYNKAKTDEDAFLKLENLMFLRANIYKSAFNKYNALNKVLDELGQNVKNTIIFISDKQMKVTLDIITKRGISVHKYTKDEGKTFLKKLNMTERQYIIKKFKSNDYQILLAIKCLDEGIDIPNAQTAILMSNSSNPREYIQRIGRIIRRYPEKEKATLYDFIIIPNYSRMNAELRKIEEKIFKKEITRILEIANNASNNVEVINKIFSIIEEK